MHYKMKVLLRGQQDKHNFSQNHITKNATIRALEKLDIQRR